VLAEFFPEFDDWTLRVPEVPGERALIDWLVLACGMT